MPEAEQDLMLLERPESGIGVLKLNRPERLNAFTPPMIAQWLARLREADADPEIRVLILTGAGKAFCAGGDSKAMENRSRQSSIEQKDFLWRVLHPVALAMERFEKPVIAAINGAARGGGMDMALMCDLRYMAESASMAESYINLGLVSGDGGAWYLSRMLRLDHAFELLLTGRVVRGAEAEKIGLVTRVVQDEALMPTALEMARQLAAQPFHALRIHKRMLYQALTMPLATHLDMVSSHTAVLRDTDEHRERVKALSEGRRPGS